MLSMRYCRTENVIAALREWEDDPGTDEHLHHELYELCSRIAALQGFMVNNNGRFTPTQDAGYCYKIADAMLEARNA